LAFTLQSLRARFLIHGMLNAYWEPLTFELPSVPAESQQHWRRCVDTALASPDDFRGWEIAPYLQQATYLVQPRSTVILVLPLQAGDESG
jgi:glycogen operon protein